MQFSRSLALIAAFGSLAGCHSQATGSANPAAQASPEGDPATFHQAPLAGLMRGINLGNGLDAPSEGEWGVTLSEQHFELAQAAKLDHVRLPVRFSAHAMSKAPYTIEPEFFARVDWAIEQATKHELGIIVDLHHYEELMEEPEAHADRFVAFWSQIAERYAKQPPSVVFELLNEPCKNLTPPKVNPLYRRAYEVIRKSNPNRRIMYDPYFWASTSYLGALDLPNDPQAIAHFHMYQPILFTHQGADWMGPEYQTTGVVFPGPPRKPLEPVADAKKLSWVRDWFNAYNTLPADKNPGGVKTIRDEFDRASRYAMRSHHPIYLGEFGAIDNADADSRGHFVEAVRSEAERRGIGWCYWDDGGKMKAMLVKEKSWVPVLHQALFGN